MEQIDGRVKDYLFDIGYHRWSRAHAKVNRTMTMTSNIAESLNSATKEARELPIQQLLKEIRMLINRWNYTNQNTAQATFTKLTFKYNAILDENLDASQHMMVRPSTKNLHSVIDNGRLFIVCLRERIYESPWTIPVEVLEQAVLSLVWNKMPGRPKKMARTHASSSTAQQLEPQQQLPLVAKGEVEAMLEAEVGAEFSPEQQH
ncbi:uncharacterized protein [Nicotiana sylvestris]|uniref:uncharacterized protein n=1 Tax=Nicotiana sylvestris TaxID=4096 RepID=UPI00388CD923